MSESADNSISGTRRVSAAPAAPVVPADGGNAPADSGKALPADRENVLPERLVEQLNRRSAAIGRELRFEVNLDSGQSVILVLDRETGEIIRQIPPEKVTPYLQEDGALGVRLYDDIV